MFLLDVMLSNKCLWPFSPLFATATYTLYFLKQRIRIQLTNRTSWVSRPLFIKTLGSIPLHWITLIKHHLHCIELSYINFVLLEFVVLEHWQLKVLKNIPMFCLALSATSSFADSLGDTKVVSNPLLTSGLPPDPNPWIMYDFMIQMKAQHEMTLSSIGIKMLLVHDVLQSMHLVPELDPRVECHPLK